MTDMLQEFCDSRGVSIRVDRRAGVIRGVKVLGLESRNGRTYLPEALAQAAQLYEDAKVNVNHPKGNPGGPRDYQDRIGTIRHVTVNPGEGLFGDFYFNPKHALAEQLAWDAEHARRTWAFRTTSRRGWAGAAIGWSSRRLPACRASTWWPIRPRRAACSRRRPRKPRRKPMRRQAPPNL